MKRYGMLTYTDEDDEPIGGVELYVLVEDAPPARVLPFDRLISTPTSDRWEEWGGDIYHVRIVTTGGRDGG